MSRFDKCLGLDTRIQSRDVIKRMGDLSLDDEIIASNEVETYDDLSKYELMNCPYFYELEFSDGSVIHATHGLRFKVKNSNDKLGYEMRRIEDLQIGDEF